MTQSSGSLNKDVFLLDTKTYTWITSFQPNSSTSSTPPISPINNNTVSISQSSKPPIGVIIGASIGGLLVVVISGIAIAFFILKHRKHAVSADYNEVGADSNQDIIEIPGSDYRNELRPEL